MILVVDETLLLEPAAWDTRFDELVDLEGDGRWCGRADGDLTVRVDPTRILVHGRLAAQVPRECDLCLAHYLEPLTADVAEVCLIGAVGAGDGVWDDEAEVWHVGLGGRLDLTEMVRQSMLLAVPTRARCGAGCPGAGQAAPTRATRSDPRLAVLASLLKNEGDDHGLSKA